MPEKLGIGDETFPTLQAGIRLYAYVDPSVQFEGALLGEAFPAL